MKITHRFAALAAASFLAVAAAGAQGTDDYNLPQGFSFYNEIGTDTIKVAGNVHDPEDYLTEKSHRDDDREGESWMAEFPGIYEKVGVSYNSEYLWFELVPKFLIGNNFQDFWSGQFLGFGGGTSYTKGQYQRGNSHRGLNADDTSFAWNGLDWGIRFTPFDIVDIRLHNSYDTPGNYLPLADKHVDGGNLAGDGLGIMVKPIDGLKLAVEIPFEIEYLYKGNFINAEYQDTEYSDDPANTSVKGTGDLDPFEKYWFRVNLGAEYTVADFLTVGATVYDVVHRQSRGYGIYVNANLGNINANLGYTYGKSQGATTVDDFDGLVKIGGRHKVNASATVAFGDLTAGVEGLFNLPVLGSYSVYDLYAGLKVGYDLLPNKFNVGLRAYTAMDIRHTYASGHYAQDTSWKPTEYGYLFYYSIAKWNEKDSEPQNEYGAAPMIGITPSVTYRTGKHEFGAKAVLEYWLNGDGAYAAKFPVYWKWNF